MNKERPGYKESLVMKAGIRIEPVISDTKSKFCSRFTIRVSRINKRGKEQVVNTPNSFKTYPKYSTKDEIGVYDKIKEIYNYYYKKIAK